MPDVAFPTQLLDQSSIWIAPDSSRYEIQSVEDEEVLLWAIDYLLGNARFLRESWNTRTKAGYDSSERARRWMLERPVVKALLKRIVSLWEEAEQKARIENAFRHQSSTS